MHTLDVLGWWIYLISFSGLFHLKVKVASTSVSLHKHLQNVASVCLCCAWWCDCCRSSVFIRSTMQSLFPLMMRLQRGIVSLYSLHHVASCICSGIIWFWGTELFLPHYCNLIPAENKCFLTSFHLAGLIVDTYSKMCQYTCEITVGWPTLTLSAREDCKYS